MITSKAVQTRERIIGEALSQGRRRGYAIVSLADIAEALELSKSAVFKHFGAKEALQLAVMEELARRFTHHVWYPARGLPTGVPRLDSIFNSWLAWISDDDGGCGLVQAQIEFDDCPGPVRAYLKKQQRVWNKTLAREFAAASRREAQDPMVHQFAFEFRSFMFGLNQSFRLLEDPGARTMTTRAYQALLERVVPNR
ncbi:TetR/AcrR family transcriptional regulator [Bradyrhizobium sp. NC92]|uniref:TetR/AcrR family transcriptional regulator n=1 Tax=Bradyrhizobium sp. (strain NC92) TaxID=55395 RepID=UPI0021AA9B87|nr:TetR/AcrR family transcriptional regulator [Bradyrhizobium sp. NC92]UWU70915.1 TetR/AcrR family transcriptional regulator [Bradyrhizobium sp. NC92]